MYVDTQASRNGCPDQRRPLKLAQKINDLGVQPHEGDQEGEGASGWVSLGEYWCEDGFGGCVVTLDGTDDDESDEANAMRFTLVSTDDTPTETDPCDETSQPGTHTVDFFASSASGRV